MRKCERKFERSTSFSPRRHLPSLPQFMYLVNIPTPSCLIFSSSVGSCNGLFGYIFPSIEQTGGEGGEEEVCSSFSVFKQRHEHGSLWLWFEPPLWDGRDSVIARYLHLGLMMGSSS